MTERLSIALDEDLDKSEIKEIVEEKDGVNSISGYIRQLIEEDEEGSY